MKKLISMALASAALTGVIAMPCNAGSENLYYYYETPGYKESTANCVPFDDSGYLDLVNLYDDLKYGYKALYNVEDHSVSAEFYAYYDRFTFVVPDDENADKTIELVNENFPDWEVYPKKDDGLVTVTVIIKDNVDKGKYFNEVIVFSKKLKEITEPQSCVYASANANVEPMFIRDDQTIYRIFDSDTNKSDDFLKYLDENKISYTIDHDVYKSQDVTLITLDLADDTTVEERFRLMKQIYDDQGLIVKLTTNTIPDIGHRYVPIYVNVEFIDNVQGDANYDGEVTIADAASILQNLGNADKYTMTAQGKYNADIDGSGLTTADAMSVMQYAAGIIDTFE